MAVPTLRTFAQILEIENGQRILVDIVCICKKSSIKTFDTKDGGKVRIRKSLFDFDEHILGTGHFISKDEESEDTSFKFKEGRKYRISG